MTGEEALDFVSKLLEERGITLNDNQIFLFLGTWENKTYGETHKYYPISCGIRQLRNVGSKLWQLLTEVLGQKVTLSKIRKPVEEAYKAYIKNQSNTSPEQEANEENILLPNPIPDVTDPASSEPLSTEAELEAELLDQPVLPDDHFYIERPHLLSSYSEIITQPSRAFLRIKSPQKTGKSSFLSRLIRELEKQDHKIARLNFDEIDCTVSSNLKNLTQYICADVSRQLGMEDRTAQGWNDYLGCIDNVINYFEEYLLPNRNDLLIIVLDSFDSVFEQPQVSTDACF